MIYKDSVCKRCSKPIKIRTNSLKAGCYCDECRKEVARLRSQKHYQLHHDEYKKYKHDSEVKTCMNCGKTYNLKNKRFCCKECSEQYYNERFLTSLTNDSKHIKISESVIRRHVKKYLIEKYGHKCSICGTITWNDQPIPLICDHINGDPSDNRLENFRLVCPNCDAQLPTFKSKNKGNGRLSKGVH